MAFSRQRTIARAVEVAGFGLFRGGDCQLRFVPADEDAGLAFRRMDLPGRPIVPATVDFVIPCERRTSIARGSATVEMIEHVMAALAGLSIDNCLVELDAVEPPVGDGSALEFVTALRAAGIVEQERPAKITRATDGRAGACIDGVEMTSDRGCIVGYQLDYPGTILGRQLAGVLLTPERFLREIAFARTFVLGPEIESLRRHGLGVRATCRNVLVIDREGVRDNAFRCPDECARHKVLDAIGDFALCGARFQGRFLGRRSGHRHNHEIAAALRASLLGEPACPQPGTTGVAA